MITEAKIYVRFPGLDEELAKCERLVALLREIKELRDELGFVPDQIKRH